MVRVSLTHIFTVGIHKIIFVEGAVLIARRQWNGGFNPFSFSLSLGTLSEQSEEKLEESQETARDAAIAVTIHT